MSVSFQIDRQALSLILAETAGKKANAIEEFVKNFPILAVPADRCDLFSNSRIIKVCENSLFSDFPLSFIVKILMNRRSNFMSFFQTVNKHSDYKDFFVSVINRLETVDYKTMYKALEIFNVYFATFEEEQRYISTFLLVEEFDWPFISVSRACDFADRFGKEALFGLRHYEYSIGEKKAWDVYVDQPKDVEEKLLNVERDLIEFSLREANGNNALHTALLKFDNLLFLEALEKGSKEQLFQLSLGNTPLLLGCKTANEKAVLKMIEKIEDPVLLNQTDSAGMTALHWASFYRMRILVDALIAKGADPNKENKQKQKPNDLYRLEFDQLNHSLPFNQISHSLNTQLDGPLAGATDLLYHMDKIAFHYLGLSKRAALFIRKPSLQSSLIFQGYYDSFCEAFIAKRRSRLGKN